jgi:hypothetical protein
MAGIVVRNDWQGRAGFRILSAPRMTIALLNGFYAPDFLSEERQRFAVGSHAPGMDTAGRAVDIADARELQAAVGLSEAEFFARHGFVLLPHVSAVGDWDEDVASVYLPEIDQLIRERLFPGRAVEVQQGPDVLRRGRGTPAPYYADGVHSDGGLNLDDYVTNVAAFSSDEAAHWWRMRYEREDVAGLVWIDFWRPTEMTGPLEHMPLALCDPTSVQPKDAIPTGQTGIAPAGRESHHLSLRYDPEQRWYYYPRMTCDEMLAFKLAEFWKEATPLRNCFHSAFADPGTPANAEQRQSCEHRVAVLVLAN